MTKLCLALAVIFSLSAPSYAEDYYVRNQAEYFAAEKKLNAGDSIILANGEWRDFEIEISGKGEKGKPIILMPQDAGQVVLTGRSNLRIGGEYILVSGLVFKDGHSPTSEVISFRRSKEDATTNSRVTETVIDNFNKPDRHERDYWVGMYGKFNRFDHNYLVGKSNQGVTLAVRLDTGESQENYHRIDHNYFGPRPILGSNGGETLRVGTSKYAEVDSFTTIENNYFEGCDGEIEIISIKSGRNIVRGNVFNRSRGALTLRHGKNNLVERNVFFGGGKDHTGGIRVIDRGQTVRGNYMEGLRGSGFASALAVMNGVPNSPANRYVQVSNALIENNTIVDSTRITFAAGSDEERSALPVSSMMRDNIIAAPGDDIIIETEDDIEGIAFTGNVLAMGRSEEIIAGMNSRSLEMVRADNGLLYPKDKAFAAIGAPRDLNPVTRDAVGPDWYPKPDNTSSFGHGETLTVMPGKDTLTYAFARAKSGDTLALNPGVYLVAEVLTLDKAITITASQPEAMPVTIAFSRTTLFEISKGGNIRLENLRINGSEAPDKVGNAVVRTSDNAMLANFEIELVEVMVTGLDVNKSFNVVHLGKGSFANNVRITNSVFRDISGSIIQAVDETDDYGRYNAEYVRIENSSFANIGEEILAIYRGGTDESTFGPHIWMQGTSISASGMSNKNQSGAAIFLHGAQDVRITGNVMNTSAPIEIVHTAGKPTTCLYGNEIAETPPAILTELIYDGAFRRLESCVIASMEKAA